MKAQSRKPHHVDARPALHDGARNTRVGSGILQRPLLQREYAAAVRIDDEQVDVICVLGAPYQSAPRLQLNAAAFVTRGKWPQCRCRLCCHNRRTISISATDTNALASCGIAFSICADGKHQKKKDFLPLCRDPLFQYIKGGKTRGYVWLMGTLLQHTTAILSFPHCYEGSGLKRENNLDEKGETSCTPPHQKKE